MTKSKRGKITVEVRKHPNLDLQDTHSVGIVTTASGYCYFCTWAGQVTEEEIRKAWLEDRKAFEAYRS